MNTKPVVIRSNPLYGIFFLLLATLSAYLCCLGFHIKDWWQIGSMAFATTFFGFVGWVALGSVTLPTCSDDDDPGFTDSNKTVPLKPGPTHHLQGAKDLPPSEKTHSLPKD